MGVCAQRAGLLLLLFVVFVFFVCFVFAYWQVRNSASSVTCLCLLSPMASEATGLLSIEYGSGGSQEFL